MGIYFYCNNLRTESSRTKTDEHEAAGFYFPSFLRLQASDPDVGDEAQLVYSLSADSPYFDVDPSSGLVYVVSAVALAGQTVAVEVKATDPQELYATTKVEVSGTGIRKESYSVCR